MSGGRCQVEKQSEKRKRDSFRKGKTGREMSMKQLNGNLQFLNDIS